MYLDDRGRIFMEESKKHKMVTVLPDGTREEVEVLLTFKFNDNNNEYIIFTKNEVDEVGNVTIYISRIDYTSGSPVLNTVSDNDEWTRIKSVLRELSKNE